MKYKSININLMCVTKTIKTRLSLYPARQDCIADSRFFDAYNESLNTSYCDLRNTDNKLRISIAN